jgi:hypothetical protein
MLERLADTRWNDVSHAYGPAGDTPQDILNLTSSLGLVRRRAIDQLIASICHQGTVYSATARAVPFLIEVVAERTVADRAAVLELLTFIAEGSGHPDESDREPPAWLGDLRRELRAGVGVFIDLLGDEDPAVRVQAINVLSRFPDARERTLPRLREVASADAEPSVRATAIAAVVLVSEQVDGEAVDMLRHAFVTDPSVTCRAAAAVLGMPRLDVSNRGEMVAACFGIAAGEMGDLGDPPPNIDSWEGAALNALRRGDVVVPDEELA